MVHKTEETFSEGEDIYSLRLCCIYFLLKGHENVKYEVELLLYFMFP